MDSLDGACDSSGELPLLSAKIDWWWDIITSTEPYCCDTSLNYRKGRYGEKEERERERERERDDEYYTKGKKETKRSESIEKYSIDGGKNASQQERKNKNKERERERECVCVQGVHAHM